jgi:alpha-1,2-glucosyltransferase
LKAVDKLVEKPRPDRGFSFAQLVADTERSAWFFGILLGALYVAAIVVLNFRPQYVDERFHFAQVMLFYRGDWRAVPEVATLPGYGALLAAIMRIIGDDWLDTTRVVHAFCGLAAVGGFFALRRRLWPGTETIATAQFLCLPLMAPLFFIIYTDVPATALLLWATWAALGGRTIVSALLFCLLVLVRQHEFLWAGLAAALILRPETGWSEIRHQWKTRLVAAVPFAAPVVLFLAFWRWNGSISLWHTDIHPDLSFHTGNVFVGLLLAGLLLPFQLSKSFMDLVRKVRSRPWLVVFPLLVFAAFWFAFRATNPINGTLPTEYLRHYTPTRVAAGLVIALAAWTLWRLKLRPTGAGAPLAFISIFFLAAIWLVEPRYVIAPFSLWLAMRQHDENWIEFVTWALWLALSIFMIRLVLIAGFVV